MAQPVQKNQSIYSPSSNLNTLPISNHSAPLFQDSLNLGSSDQNTTIFDQFWNAIVNFFKSIWFRFSTSQPTPTSIDIQTHSQPRPTSMGTQTKIQEIAARDRFIWFYKKEENPLTAFMGNFHPCTIRLWGMQFKCAEAAFQAAKFMHNKAQMRYFENLDGEAAFKLGRELSRKWTHENTTAWRNLNRDVMREVVRAKFEQNADLKQLLLATGNAFIVEHIPVKGRDAYWGDDSDGTGKNWLGRIVMETRRDLGGAEPVPRNPQYDQFLNRG